MIYRILTLLALIVVIGVFFLQGSRQTGTSVTAAPPPSSADLGYVAHNARLVETGADGRPTYTLDADQLRQRPNEANVQLDVVRMSFSAADGDRWTLRADHGQVSNDGGQIDVSGNVHVSGVLAGSAAKAEIATTVMSFDTRAQIATTHQPVTLDWAGSKVAALGLVANLKDRRVQLESRVHAVYSP